MNSAAAAISKSCSRSANGIYNIILDYSQAEHKLHYMQVDAPDTFACARVLDTPPLRKHVLPIPMY